MRAAAGLGRADDLRAGDTAEATLLAQTFAAPLPDRSLGRLESAVTAAAAAGMLAAAPR